jgi:two-component system KDP operon response regulator KdpE
MTAPPPKILVIDDEPPIRKLLRMGLSTQGYQVLEAATGKASLEMLEQEPDLIVLDLMLPGMSGYTVCESLRSAGCDVPILMLTAKDDIKDRVAGLDAGADDPNVPNSRTRYPDPNEADYSENGPGFSY